MEPWLTILAASSVLVVGVAAYRVLWWRRYATPPAGWPVLRGTVVGGELDLGRVLHCATASGLELFSRPLELRARDGSLHRVHASGAVLCGPAVRHPAWGRLRCVSVGDRITVCGPAASEARAEAHYREASGRAAISAARVAAGTWPEARWLAVPLLAAALVGVCSLGVPLFAPPPPHLCVSLTVDTPTPTYPGRVELPLEAQAADALSADRGEPLGHLYGTMVGESYGTAAVDFAFPPSLPSKSLRRKR
jgi:hypothetical protein